MLIAVFILTVQALTKAVRARKPLSIPSHQLRLYKRTCFRPAPTLPRCISSRFWVSTRCEVNFAQPVMHLDTTAGPAKGEQEFSVVELLLPLLRGLAVREHGSCSSTYTARTSDFDKPNTTDQPPSATTWPQSTSARRTRKTPSTATRCPNQSPRSATTPSGTYPEAPSQPA